MEEEFRKLSIDDDSYVNGTNEAKTQWNKLDDVMVETVLARLATMEILRCQFVCKRWKSIIHYSPTFSITSKQLFNRHPWFFFFVFKSKSSSAGLVYDMEVSDWRRIHLPLPDTDPISGNEVAPVASSAGLMCFRVRGKAKYSLIVNNPLTGVSRSLPKIKTYGNYKGIAMHASKSGTSRSNYKVFVVYGDWPNLVLKVFTSPSSSEQEEEEAAWRELPAATVEDEPRGYRRPKERLVGVTSLGNEGQIIVNYLNRRTGRLICFDTKKGTFCLSPRIKGRYVNFFERYVNMDLVLCCDGNGISKVLGVVLVEEFEDSIMYVKLRIFEFDHENSKWNSITSRIMFQTFEVWTWNADIKCSAHGYGDCIMICLNAVLIHMSQIVMYNIKENSWVVLPRCFDDNDRYFKRYLTPFSFMPDIQANV